MQSLWSKTAALSERKEMPGKSLLPCGRQVQNVVIGAGMAGILTAYFLKKSGREVIILEAGKIAGGQTKNTTAKITGQHGLIYHDMIKKAGKERAKGYAMANEAAIRAYKEIIQKEGISCHFEMLPSFLYSIEEAGKELLQREAEAAVALGLKAYFTEKDKQLELPFPVTGQVCFEQQAQFHPLEFIEGLSAGLTIYENTNVLSVKGHKVTTDKGTITAENIIFATHYPFINIPGFYFVRQHQERSYVLALQGEGVPAKLAGMYYGIDRGGLSFRSAEGMLLLGGGSHRTGKRNKCGREQTKPNREVEKQQLPEGYAYLREMSQRYYPRAQEGACWAAQDCMPHDRIPFIGKYSVIRPYWYVATGFQKWGMTSSMIAAMIISDNICGRVNPYEKVFTPQRILLRAGIKNFCIDLGESVAGLTKGFLGKKEKRCRHMGCHLVWNEEEKSWDCPCHGSRFEKDGRLIDNPAQRNLKI